MNALQKLAAKKKLTYMLSKVAQVAGYTDPRGMSMPVSTTPSINMSMPKPPPPPPVNMSIPKPAPKSTSKPIVLKGTPAQKERFRKNTLNTLATGQSSAMRALRTSGSTPPPRTGQPLPPVAGRRY